MRNRTLVLALTLIGCCSALNAASVTVNMNNVSKTMSLVSATTGEPVDVGQPSATKYSFEAAAGSYILSAYATDGTTLNGTIQLDIQDSSVTQEFNIITCTAYATNDKNTWSTDNGDYTFEVSVVSREGVTQIVTPGSSVTKGRHTFLAFNGNSYYASFIPGASRVVEGYTTLYKSGTLTANVDVKGAIPKGENYTVTIPDNAYFQLNMKFAHFVDFTPVEPVERLSEGGTTRLTYYLSHGQVYNFRTGISGKLTRAGYFTMSADAAKRPVLDFRENDYDGDPALVNHSPLANEGYETGGIFVNINERGHLRLRQGDTFSLHSMRTWELSDNSTNNYFIEPDFHYTVINSDGTPSNGVVEIIQKPGSAWSELKAVGAGDAIVLVTYDAIGLNYYNGADRKPYMGGEFWGAIWPENTAAFVVSVGGTESAVTPNMVLNENYNMDALRLAGNNVDAEHDVFYYLDSEEGARFTFTPSGVAQVTMAYPEIGDRMATYTGFGTEGVTANEDGSYTLLLRHGRQIVKLTDAGGNSVYQVLTAKSCHREIINMTRPESSVFQPGDQVKVQYSGLFHPANKIAGIYNMSAYVTYNGVPNGSSLILGAGQYTFASVPSAQAVIFDIPVDHDVSVNPRITMSKGVIQVNGYGDPIGNHRNIDNVAGRSPNFTAVPHKTYFGMIPDVTVDLSEFKEFVIETTCNVPDADIRLSFNGKELELDADGRYSGTYGTYSVAASRKGYRCTRTCYYIGDDAEGVQTFDIEMSEAPDAWDGVSVSEPSVIDGVCQISNGAELAWFARQSNNGSLSDAEVVNDIDLGNYDWTPIGENSSKPFKGSFKGNGHKVEGLFIDAPTGQYKGLFGYVKGSEDRPVSISGIVVEGKVSAKEYVGGIAGCINSFVEIDRCANLADVSGSGKNVGGIVGSITAKSSSVTNCYNKGVITGSGNCGGIVGGHGNYGVTVKNVFNLGEIICPKNAGACVGSSYKKSGLENAFSILNYDRTENHTLVTPEQIESGEIAYRLGEAFGQEIGKDEHPVFDGMKVMYDPYSDTYYNESVDTSADMIECEDATPVLYYNLDGIASETPFKGVNIVVMSDGEIRRLIVR